MHGQLERIVKVGWGRTGSDSHYEVACRPIFWITWYS